MRRLSIAAREIYKIVDAEGRVLRKRTAKKYTHALLQADGKLISCHLSEENAQKRAAYLASIYARFPDKNTWLKGFELVPVTAVAL